ncbi:helix-turn-helix domain-containing protein [Verrucosispora sp. TAA-831]|uniref:helix-turn-helix domain-containing protein n=1 Tax=Verrucosispora sp. TAA-831 TaxID=3422227 RepID=UPI003D6E5E34
MPEPTRDTVDDIVDALLRLIADPPAAGVRIREEVTALVERARKASRAVPGQELREYRHELKKMRLAADLMGEQVATEMGWCVSKVYRIEQGQVGVSVTDMRHLARLYGADEPTVTRLVAESRAGYRIGPRRGSTRTVTG